MSINSSERATTVVRVPQGATVEVHVPAGSEVRVIHEQHKRLPLSAQERAILKSAIALCQEASVREEKRHKGFLALLLGR